MRDQEKYSDIITKIDGQNQSFLYLALISPICVFPVHSGRVLSLFLSCSYTTIILLLIDQKSAFEITNNQVCSSLQNRPTHIQHHLSLSLSFALFASGSLRNPVHMTLELCLKTGSLPYHQLFNFGSYRTSSVLMAAGTWFRCSIFFSHGITGLSPGLSQFGFVLLLFDLPMVQSTPGFQLVVD